MARSDTKKKEIEAGQRTEWTPGDKTPDFNFDNIHEKPNVIRVLDAYYRERDGDDYLSAVHTPKQVADYFITDRTWKDLNTGSTGMELSYAFDDETTDEQLQRLSVVRRAWDKLPARWEDGGRGFENLSDSFYALATDPANIAGLGLGTLISKYGMKAIAATALNVGLDAGINAAAETAHQSIDMKVGTREEYDPVQIGVAAALGGAPSAVAAGIGFGGRKFFGEAASPLDAPNLRTTNPTKGEGAPGRQFFDYNDPTIAGKGGPAGAAAPNSGRTPEDIVTAMAEGPSYTDEAGTSRLSTAPNFRPDDVISRAGEITEPEQLEAILQKIATDEGIDWNSARAPGGGKKVTDAQLREMADKYGFNLDFLRNKTNAVNASTIVVAKRALASTSAHLRRAAATAAQNPADANALAKFRNTLNLHAAVQFRFAGLAAEAGRSLRAFRGDLDFGVNDGRVSAQIDQITDLVGRLGGPQKLSTLAQKISVMDEAALARFSRKATAPGAGDKIAEVFKSGLLWNPKTQFVNILSNFTVAQNRMLVENSLAYGSGKVRQTIGKMLGKKVDAASKEELLASTVGYWKGSVDAVKTMKNVWMTEGIYGNSRLDLPAHRVIPGKQGEVIRLSMRALNSADAFFKVTAERSYLYREAIRIAQKEGLEGQNMYRRAADLVESPTDAMRRGATAFSEEMTFQTELGDTGKHLMRLVNSLPLATGHIVVPFIRTPLNLAKFALRRLPGIGELDTAFDVAFKGRRMTGREVDQMVARQIQGTALFAATVAAVNSGLMTGSNEETVGDVKGHELNRLRASATGSQPFSFHVGDMYYSYNQFDPFAMLVGMAADTTKVYNRAAARDKGSDAFLRDMALGVFKSTTSTLISKTWAQGVEDFAKTLGDNPEYNIARFLQSRVAAFTPTIIAHWARTHDHVVRVPSRDSFLKGLADAVAANIPGKSQEAPPMIGLFGEVVTRNAGPLEPGMDMLGFTTREAKNDPIKAEVLRLTEEAAMPPVRPAPASVRGYKMTDEERRVYQYVKGTTLINLLTGLMADPEYIAGGDNTKIDVVKDAEGLATNAATMYLYNNYPSFKKGMHWAKVDAENNKNVPEEVERYWREVLGVRPVGAQ